MPASCANWSVAIRGERGSYNAERIEATGGMDEVARLIADGVPLTEIAKRAGVTDGGLLTWLEADPERSARARAVRQATARMWDERAGDVIQQAANPFELSKAKELAHHYRWRASKIAPRDYGDRIQADVGGGVTVHCRTGSSEIGITADRATTAVHCRTGSSEKAAQGGS